MIVAYVVCESFSHADYGLLEANCRAFAGEFEGDESEFFYYLKASEIERYFFIRTNTRDREKFIEAARAFGRNLDFEVLQKRETNVLLKRIKLSSFE